MDAPPPQEDVRAFHQVQRLLLRPRLQRAAPLAVDETPG